MRAALLLATIAHTTAQITCDFSQCQEHSFGRRDGDCCGYDSATFCPSGSTKIKVLQSRTDVTWINAPAGFPSNWGGHVCSSSAPYRGNTCCINGYTATTIDDFVLISTPRTWSAARSDCLERGGDLAWITSEEENAKAYSLTNGAIVWLGLTDTVAEGSWKWADGTPVTWLPASGEGFRRDNYGGNEDCGGFWSGRWNTVNAGMWDDLGGGGSCNAAYAYICRIPPPSPSTPPPSSPPPLLPPSLPPPDTLPLILGSAAGVLAVLLSLCLLAVLVCKKKCHRAPTNTGPRGISMGDASIPISTGTVGGLTDSRASSHIGPSGVGLSVGQPVVGEVVAPTTGGAWGARFDTMTGQPIPKFDPLTGKQNWEDARSSSEIKV